jgi:hypothetical protein
MYLRAYFLKLFDRKMYEIFIFYMYTIKFSKPSDVSSLEKIYLNY